MSKLAQYLYLSLMIGLLVLMLPAQAAPRSEAPSALEFCGKPSPAPASVCPKTRAITCACSLEGKPRASLAEAAVGLAPQAETRRLPRIRPPFRLLAEPVSLALQEQSTVAVPTPPPRAQDPLRS